MKKVLILGGASFDSIIYLDKFPEPIPQTIHQSVFQESVGSTGIGKAANFSKLGHKTSLQLVFGDDIYGDRIKDYFSDKPVDLYYDIDPSGTERHVNIMDKDGRRISIFVKSTSKHQPIDYDSYENLIIQSDIVVLNIVDYARNFIPLLQKHNIEVWTDLHDYDEGNEYHQDFIKASDYIFLSSDNLSDYKSTMIRLMQHRKQLIVCTHGPEGATALTAGGQWIESGILDKYKLVDSNGAGDAFFSGFLYAHLNGEHVRNCLKYGHILGALCINSPSIAPENLSASKVEQIYKENYL